MKIEKISLICLAMIFFTGCPAKPYRTLVSEEKDFKCEIPSNWIIRKGSTICLLAIMTDEDVESVSAHICIFSKQMTAEKIKKYMEIDRATWANYPHFSIEPLKTIQIGDYTGMTYSITNLDSSMVSLMSHQPVTLSKPMRFLPVPKPVMVKETYIYFSALGKDYGIDYTAPVAIYDKYYPALEHLLKTFKRINIKN
jgi:hypothetical protein